MGELVLNRDKISLSEEIENDFIQYSSDHVNKLIYLT